MPEETQANWKFCFIYKRTVDEVEAVEAVEDSPTLAEAGLTGEVGVVAVEAEVEGVAAEAGDEHLPPLLKENNLYIFFSYQKLL